MSPLLGAREKAKTKKPRFRKCGFSWFAHTGLYISLVGGKGGGKNKKKHTLQNVVFSWFAHTGLYVTSIGGAGGGKNEKTTF